MSERTTEKLIERLASEAVPVEPLPAPERRGLTTLAALLAAGAAAAWLFGDIDGLRTRYAGREALMMAEMAAMLATSALALIGAFVLSVPGRSRTWLLTPLPPFALWLSLSGIGCYQDLVRLGPGGWGWGHGRDCLLFILGASLAVGGPLLWRLSRARPIDPLPVALLGGLAAASLSAFLLQFFHPPALTLLDLAVHFASVLLVVGIAALLRRRTLRPA